MNLSIMLRSADGFCETAKMLYSTHRNGVVFLATYISPFTLNCAFACELYLKYLYAKEHNGKNHSGHSLISVYQKTSSEVQSQIQEDYKKHSNVLSIEECLKVHDLAFKDFRYFHELKKDKTYAVEPQSLYNLMIALRNTCATVETEETDNAH